MKPYISVICPCYNGESFIEGAIMSVIGQPFDSLELIIIDDGSYDYTPNICKKYQSQKVHYYRTKNLGAGHARNFGLSKAEGTWIFYLDSDDLYLKDAFNTEFINKLKKYEHKNLDIIYTSYVSTNAGMNRFIKCFEDFELEKDSFIPINTFWAAIYRRTYLINNKIKFYEYQRQDVESAFRFMAYFGTDKRIIDNDIRFYLQHENLSSNTHTWNFNTVSEVKSRIFYDLFLKHIHDKSAVCLMKETMIALEQYYISCRVNRLVDLKTKESVNKIAAKCLIKYVYPSIRALGLKKYLRLFVYYILINTVWDNHNQNADTIDSNDSTKRVQIDYMSTEQVLDKLVLISRFLAD